MPGRSGCWSAVGACTTRCGGRASPRACAGLPWNRPRRTAWIRTSSKQWDSPGSPAKPSPAVPATSPPSPAPSAPASSARSTPPDSWLELFPRRGGLADGGERVGGDLLEGGDRGLEGFGLLVDEVVRG